MGSAAELFYNANPDIDTLHRRITPTLEEQEEQQAQWQELAEFLKVSLKEKTGLSIQTCLEGSCKLGTQIRPWSQGEEFSIDLGVYFEWNGEPENGDYGAKELKGFVQKALIEYHSLGEYGCSGVDEPMEHFGRIRFRPNFHIDVACYHLDPENDCRSLATENWFWQERDSKALYEWFDTILDDETVRDKWRRQVQYLKMWSNLYFVESNPHFAEEDYEKPSSLLITLITAITFMAEDASEDDDTLFAKCVDLILYYICSVDDIKNPIDESECVGLFTDDGGQDVITAFERLSDICQPARRETDKPTAAKIWAEVFEHFFPITKFYGDAVNDNVR